MFYGKKNSSGERENERESRERRGGMEGDRDKEQRNTFLVDVKGPACMEASRYKNTH